MVAIPPEEGESMRLSVKNTGYLRDSLLQIHSPVYLSPIFSRFFPDRSREPRNTGMVDAP
ncbi:MAG TPA: hypothetical protein DEA78_05670 [Cyanobacteria bacterium UBA11159]|nr:hypothetical protein [Cyanobacteria bacterium UBA11166]HBR73211.1 hypothetical protein [Cyanobacteria bacterium UBA11159]HCA97718.1 hypothetical protein [Cyanobacteria bacterium UBA9226]